MLARPLVRPFDRQLKSEERLRQIVAVRRHADELEQMRFDAMERR